MHPFNILLVDDEEVQLKKTQNILELAGFRDICAFDSPVDALEYARSNPPDLLITDYYMPILYGGQLLRKLLHLYPSLPAIIVTGSKTHLLGCENHAVVQRDSQDYRQRLIIQVKRIARRITKTAPTAGYHLDFTLKSAEDITA